MDPLTAADEYDFEVEGETPDGGFAVQGVGEDFDQKFAEQSQIAAALGQAAEALKAQRSGLSGRQRLGALLLGFAQPTKRGKWQEYVVNAATALGQRSVAQQALDEKRRQELARMENAQKIAMIRANAAKYEADKRAEASVNKPPAMAPVAFDDDKNPMNPFSGERMAPGTVIGRDGKVYSLAELQKRYGMLTPPQGAGESAAVAAPTPDVASPAPAQPRVSASPPSAARQPPTTDRKEQIVTRGGVQFLIKPDGTSVRLGATPPRLRPATREEASAYGATAGQIDETTGKFEPAKEAPTVKEEQKEDKSRVAAIEKADRVISDVDRALSDSSPLSTGIIGAVTQNIPSTPAYNLRQLVKPIQAALGFDELAKMREASPTGGALGQVAVKELEFLQSAVASLEQAQSTDQFREALGKVRTHYQRWRAAVEKERRVRPQGTLLPSRDAFIAAARKANPRASEAALNAAYERKYGGR